MEGNQEIKWNMVTQQVNIKWCDTVPSLKNNTYNVETQNMTEFEKRKIMAVEIDALRISCKNVHQIKESKTRGLVH